MTKFTTRTFRIAPTKLVPNSRFPLIIYKSAFPSDVSPDAIEEHFEKNKWVPQWRYGMYEQAHFHSTVHEALGVYQGSAHVRFGVSDKEFVEGDIGTLPVIEVDISTGDVIVIPAGIAHRCIEERDDFKMVGAYPEGAEQWDMNYGGEKRVVDVAVPKLDPFLGNDGDGLKGLWADE